jgi:predicted nucleotide-binding protein
VGYAIVLLTPDDLGHLQGKPKEIKSRARQNVVLELGYFMGKLSRKRVCALSKGDVEMPSDYHGVLVEVMDEDGGWKIKLAREMKSAGLAIDLNKIE